MNLISTTSLVQTPYILVKIGDYTFGCYNEQAVGSKKYPNYINSLEITKINGQVNTYTLRINYTITEHDDPNYFEKVFSSVSISRDIEFTYGDLSAKNYIYRNEKAMITKVASDFNIDSSMITYTVSAISTGVLATTGSYSFPSRSNTKPSDVIKEIVSIKTYGLQDLFPGMRDSSLVDELIAGNDLPENIQAQTNISVLDYLQYLVDLMTPDRNTDSVKRGSFYIMNFIDDTTGIYDGSYFKVVQVDVNKQFPEAYDLYIGYPNSNVVDNFHVENSENYSIYYEYQAKLHPEQYVRRINNLGEWEDVYAPIISSKNSQYETREQDRSWWSKVTQYPLNASLDIKGLLRPAVLMSYVRLYIYFYGRLHINSGIYMITKQVDSISESGYKTTLNLTRISDDSTMNTTI